MSGFESLELFCSLDTCCVVSVVGGTERPRPGSRVQHRREQTQLENSYLSGLRWNHHAAARR